MLSGSKMVKLKIPYYIVRIVRILLTMRTFVVKVNGRNDRGWGSTRRGSGKEGL